MLGMKVWMRSAVSILLTVAFVLSLAGCSAKEPSIRQSYEKTESSLYDSYFDEGKDFNYITFYELTDGTWKTDRYSYKYRVEVSGQLPNSSYRVQYVYLSQEPEISFDSAWKASGFSSSQEDYFEEKDAVLATIRRLKD